MNRTLIVASLVAIIMFGNVMTSSASSISATIEPDRVHVKALSSLTQNITSLFEKKITVSGGSLANATGAFERHVKTRIPGASVKSLSVQCAFTNNTINLSVEFDVVGVVSKREEVITANLTWRALNVTDDLSAENANYNLVGKAYFRDAISRYENMTATLFYDNRTTPITAYRARDIAGNITMLQFKPIETPLSKWEMVYNIAKAETSYRAKLGRTVDLVARRELNTSITEFGVWMDLTGEIVASGYARLKGEVLVSEAGIGIVHFLMLAAVVVPLVVAAALHMIEKKSNKR